MVVKIVSTTGDVRTRTVAGKKRKTTTTTTTASGSGVRIVSTTGDVTTKTVASAPTISEEPKLKEQITITKLTPTRIVRIRKKFPEPPPSIVRIRKKFPEPPPSIARLPEIPRRRAERGLRKAQAELDRLKIEIQRAKPEEKFKLKRELKIAKQSVKEFALSTFIGFKQLPSALVGLAKDPTQVKKIPSIIREGGVKFGKTLRITPTTALVQVVGEILVLRGVGRLVKIIGKLGSKASARISPKFREIKGSTITIPTGQTGKTININIAGRIGAPSLPTETLIKQAKISGKEVTAVSTQADKLISLVKTKRVIRKPIPNEELLSRRTRKLLIKFDRGIITRRQLRDLELRVRAETRQSLLERSLFADPKGRIRPSRLGIEPREATLLDILAGEVTFKTLKPQILVFEKVKVQEFPKTIIFKNIKKKFAQNKPLTASETRALLEFQLKKAGKFKPIGTLTKEPEITLAPGEIIKKKKILGVTLIRGRKVNIVQVEIIKPSRATAKLLKKSRIGKITKKELRKLRSNLKKETGFKTSLSRKRVRRKIVRARPLIRARIKRKPTRKKRPPKAPPRRPPTRPPKAPPRRPPTRPPKAPPRRPPTRPPKAPPRRPPTRPPKAPPRITIPVTVKAKKRKKRRLKKKPKRPQAFQVLARPLKRIKKARRPKLIKVSKVPLSKKTAKDLRNYITDTSLSRTATIKPIKGKPTKSRLKIPKGYARKTSRKFRRFRKVKGKKVLLSKGKVIERGSHLLDTRQEKKQITLKRRIAQIRKPPIKRKIIKRKSPRRERGIFG